MASKGVGLRILILVRRLPNVIIVIYLFYRNDSLTNYKLNVLNNNRTIN